MATNKEIVIQRANELIQGGRITVPEIAERIKITEGEVKRILDGFRLPNGTRHLEKLEAFMNELAEKKDNTNEFKFVNTSVSKRIKEIVNLAQRNKEIVMIVAPSGLGKTSSLKFLAENDPEIIFLECEVGWSLVVLFRQIYSKLISETAGSISLFGLYERVKAELKKTKKTLVIDECELLSVKCIESLRRIFDTCGVGLVLCGMPRLISVIRGKHGEFSQLLSRISCLVNINSLVDADFELLVKQTLPNSDGLWKVFKDNARGNLRRLNLLIKRSIRIAQINKSAVVTKAIVENAAKMLLD